MEPSVSCRAVVTDLDGTIVRRDGTLTAATIDTAAALSAKGIVLIAATARTPGAVRILDPLLPHLRLAVCCGGSLGWCPATDRLLWQENIDAAIVRQIIGGVTRFLPDAGVAAYDGRRWVMTPAYAATRTEHGPCEIAAPAEIDPSQVCQMSICHSRGDADRLASELVAAMGIGPAFAAIICSAPDVVDIAAPGIDKYSGVSRALSHLGIAAADSIAFGDMPNDLPMFRLCGSAVAVGNAHPEVLAAAGAITHSVEEDGFTFFLRGLGIVAMPTALG